MDEIPTIKNKKLVLLSLGVIGFFYLFSLHQFEVWKFGVIGGGDTWGYYLYLPATFIQQDLDSLDHSIAVRRSYEVKPTISDKNPLGSEELQYLDEGKYVNKYTLGVSLFYAPFFFLAHFLASPLGYPADGYSFIYIYLLHVSSIVYVLIGLYVLYLVLRSFFPEKQSLVTIFIVALSTNLYYFTTYNSPMAHAYLFFLYCLVLYFSQRWHRDKRIGQAIGIGLSCGLITLIRPTEIICVLIPILWGVKSLRAISNRLKDLFRNRQFYVAIVFFIITGIPQLIYWKWITGNFFYYSYIDEGFNFLKPQILNGLFSFQNGWLAYTPVMYFALLGILLFSRKKDYFFPVLFFLPIHIYITYSWWCWNYINGFGSRPMVETYALLSLPLAATLYRLFSFQFGRWFAIITLCFFIYLNLFNTYQLSLGVLWSENANWPFYKAIFGKTSLSKTDLIIYDSEEPQPDTSQLVFKKLIHQNGFEDSTSVEYTHEHVRFGNYCYALSANRQESPEISFNLQSEGVQDGDWLKLSIYCMRTYEGNEIYRMSKMLGISMRDNKNLKWRGVRLDNKPGNTNNGIWGGKPNIWERVDFWFRISKVDKRDIFKTYVWNTTGPLIYLDNHQVSLYSPKQ